MTVKGNQKTLHRQIRSQFEGKPHLPFVAADHEISNERSISWRLRAKQAPENIREDWCDTSWIVEVAATGARKCKPIQAIHLILISLTTSQEALLHWFEIAGALRVGTELRTPSSMKTATASAIMALGRWPNFEEQLSTCCGRLALSQSGPG